MNIEIFNRKYWVRRFGDQKEILGYLISGTSDFVAFLHVHPGQDQVPMNPEGERRVVHLQGHGSVKLYTAAETVSHKGDLLLYQGRWYECTSAMLYDHTMLSHYNYSFTLVPNDGAYTPDIWNAPEEDPASKKPGEGVFTPDDGALLTLVKIKTGGGLSIDRDGYLSLSEDMKETLKQKLKNGPFYDSWEGVL